MQPIPTAGPFTKANRSENEFLADDGLAPKIFKPAATRNLSNCNMAVMNLATGLRKRKGQQKRMNRPIFFLFGGGGDMSKLPICRVATALIGWRR